MCLQLTLRHAGQDGAQSQQLQRWQCQLDRWLQIGIVVEIADTAVDETVAGVDHS